MGWLLCFFLLPPSLLSSLLPPDVSLLSVLDESLLSVFWSSVSSLLFPLEESLSPLSRLLEDMLQSLLGSSLFESNRLWSFSRKTITFLHSHPHFLLLKVCSLLQLALDAIGHSHLQVSGLRTCGFEQRLRHSHLQVSGLRTCGFEQRLRHSHLQVSGLRTCGFEQHL